MRPRLLLAVILSSFLLAGGVWLVTGPGEDAAGTSDEVGHGSDVTGAGQSEVANDRRELNTPTSVETRSEALGADANEPIFDSLPDGEHFGWVTAVTTDAVAFDPAEFLTGEAALSEAREDGRIGPGDDIPNGFYIRNRETVSLRLPVAVGFEARLLENTDLSRFRTLDAEGVAAMVAGETDTSWLYGPVELLPAVLHVQDGAILWLEQRYVP